MHKSSQYIVVTATGTVVTGPCLLAGVVLHDVGGNTFLVYDDTQAANLVFKFQQTAAGQVICMFEEPVSFSRGIHLAVTGATSTCTFLLV